jgi:outer membrane biosynthesis protein TonB
LHAASLPLDAQPLSVPADQPAIDAGASFEERFSPELRARPVFTLPDIQGVIASMPPSAPPAEAIAADEGAEPQPAESTASVAIQEPSPETAASVPTPQVEPDIPPPPYPPDIAIASEQRQNESAPAAIIPAPERILKAPAAKRAVAKQSARRVKERRKAAQNLDVATTSATRGRNTPSGTAAPATNPAASCPAGVRCLSQQQTFAIFFGFIAGALIGGPIGAVAGGAAGAIMTSDTPPRTSTSPPQRR